MTASTESVKPSPIESGASSPVTSPIVTVDHLSVRFPMPTPLLRKLRGEHRGLTAVDDVSLVIRAGRSLAIVGESGSGKSTLARTMCGLQQPTAGRVDVNIAAPASGNPDRPRMQMVFQDPSSSLDPRQRVGDAIEEVLEVHRIVTRDRIEARRNELLALVGLPTSTARVLPKSLSGGQRQRVAIARALANEPGLLLADEAVASLDVSVKASIVRLLRSLQTSLGLALVMITHDLATVRHACDDVAVMYLGRIVEHGTVADVMDHPLHPYTRALIGAIPRLHQPRSAEPSLHGEAPSPLSPPSGCAFHTRCPLAQDRCRVERPMLVGVTQHAACHVTSPAPQQTPTADDAPHPLGNS
jgi:oligopeptide/dipeptide ABC transporter ATP-binding protein